MSLRRLQGSILFLSGFALLGIHLSASFVMLVLSYVLICTAMVMRSALTTEPWRKRIFHAVFYMITMILQIVFVVEGTFSQDPGSFQFTFCLVISVVTIPLPVLAQFFFHWRQEYSFLMTSVQELGAAPYAQLVYARDKPKGGLFDMEKVGKAFSKENLLKALEQLQDQNSFRYINNGSLTQEYFDWARESLEDEHVYVVLTDTGSPASEIISVFTQRKFNHVSLSFDEQLHTIISYNGGEKVYPPGMNPEKIAWFHQKEDSAVLIYRLKATRRQKEKMIEKIYEINHEGSAYNILGLILKYSFKPNIMFCSQFVHHILQHAGLAYLDKKSAAVRPSDFVELDYRRNLEFVREIKFG